MKRLLFVSFLTISLQALLGQVKIDAYFGVTGRTDVARDILELYDNGYYITGRFEGSGDFNYGWNLKTDINIELVYDQVFEHSMSSVANTKSVSDSYGNIYLTGFITYPEKWPFVTKIDSCGNTVWCKILQYDNEFEDGTAQDILISDDNEIIVLADFDSEEEIHKVHLIGLNENGEVLWIKPYASKTDYPWIQEPNAYSIKEINNDFYISGYCYWPYPDDTTHWFLRPLFIGIDSLFDEKWILPFAPLDSIFGVAFNTIPLSDTVLMGVGYRLSGSEIYNSILLFYDLNGNEIGYTQFANESIGNNIDFNAVRDVKTISNSLYISPYFVGIGGETYFGEFIYDTSGTIYNNTIRDVYKGNSSILKTSDNNYVIEIEVAESKSDDDIYVYKIDENLNDVPFDPTPHTYDSLCPGGIQSGTIDLTSCFVWTDVSEAPSPGEYCSFIQTIPIKVFPNPATEGSVTFEFENTEHHRNMELRCFNVYGEMVHSERIYRYQEKTEVNINGWQKGMYFGVVYSDGKPLGKCKFVVQ